MDLELLRKLGEETIYSAKGHFKASDLRRILITWTIWICALINVIGILGFPVTISKYISIAGLLGTVALLLWNNGEGKNYRSRHKSYGEKYLVIHKEIRSYYFQKKNDIEQLELLNKKVQELDNEPKPDIPSIAHRMARNAIEKKGETDNWYK
jgi:hypothetical protein